MNSVKKIVLFFIVFHMSYSAGMEHEDESDSERDWFFINKDDSTAAVPAINNLLGVIKVLKDRINSLEAENKQLKATQNNVLEWVTKHGGPPKCLKLLLPNEEKKEQREHALQEARKQHVIRNGSKYSIETAIISGNLNFTKEYFPPTNLSQSLSSNEFKAMAFYIAACNRSLKIARYLAQDEFLFNNQSIMLLYTLMQDCIKDHTIDPIIIIFTTNVCLKKSEWDQLLNSGIEKAKEGQFTECVHYLNTIKFENALFNKVIDAALPAITMTQSI